MKIEFYRHNLGDEEKSSVSDCLDSVFLTTGSFVKEFETRFANYFNSAFAVGVNSCTAALHLSLLALGIGQGDEVITTPMTFIATPNSVLYVGAKPVFVDVEPTTGLIDWRLIEDKITPKTKAIMPVHLYGQMCDMIQLRKIADKHGLKIIEDCAHAVESIRDRIKPGQLSDAACFSFYATKNLTCGEGGAVVTNNAKIADRINVLRQHGMSKSAADRYTGRYQHWDMTELGWKYNMDNIKASILLPQIPKIEERWHKRHSLYQAYIEELKGLTTIEIPQIMSGVKSAYHLFSILVAPDLRDRLLDELSNNNIGCAVNYRAVHLSEYYRSRYGYTRGSFPNAEHIGDRTISLPFWIGMGRKEISFIAESLSRFFLHKGNDR